jgi:isopenicillin N synthase-like dioxygenase
MAGAPARGRSHQVDISKSDNFRGYMGLLTENNDPKNKGDYHEAFNLGLDPLLAPESMGAGGSGDSKLQHGENQWPTSENWAGSAEFKDTTLEYYKAVLGLGQRLFPLIALALDLPESFFDDKIRHPAAIMRLLFYPELGDREVDELMPGIGAHTDFECFTILRQDDVPALQVANRRGEWLDAQCIPDTFVVNIGDQLARWTNDIFVSTRHRVLPTVGKDRFSIPFFFGCDHDVVMDPIPTCVSADRPNRYEVMTAGDYVHMRLSDIYAAGVKGEVKA